MGLSRRVPEYLTEDPDWVRRRLGIELGRMHSVVPDELEGRRCWKAECELRHWEQGSAVLWIDAERHLLLRREQGTLSNSSRTATEQLARMSAASADIRASEAYQKAVRLLESVASLDNEIREEHVTQWSAELDVEIDPSELVFDSDRRA